MEQIDWSKVKVGDEVEYAPPKTVKYITYMDDVLINLGSSPDRFSGQFAVNKSSLTPENFRVIPQPKFKAGDVVKNKNYPDIYTVLFSVIDDTCNHEEQLMLRNKSGECFSEAASKMELVEAAK